MLYTIFTECYMSYLFNKNVGQVWNCQAVEFGLCSVDQSNNRIEWVGVGEQGQEGWLDLCSSLNQDSDENK